MMQRFLALLLSSVLSSACAVNSTSPNLNSVAVPVVVGPIDHLGAGPRISDEARTICVVRAGAREATSGSGQQTVTVGSDNVAIQLTRALSVPNRMAIVRELTASSFGHASIGVFTSADVTVVAEIKDSGPGTADRSRRVLGDAVDKARDCL